MVCQWLCASNTMPASKLVCLQQQPSAVLLHVRRQGGTAFGPLTNGANGGFGGEHKPPFLDIDPALVLA